ncbi:hypothetical protein EG19_07775 [Thermoanaerobaculum aquaticum]|uniref:Glycosyltransferase 2-like domain-containing protein n=2 Tax=Thermoanaerobaculum aquaticum TaxID=1312852 RepID=A0A062XX61_9BACT|nr:hypothetical protein EG19_07775 [Thermoanaerobaculum aquaticum]
MQWPVVSVVTPSLNSGQFIQEAIDSVLGQDYPHIDYLVVDGGSTDKTLSFLKKRTPYVRWVSEPDRGQAAAINKGWRMAEGEIIAWLNADDLYRPGAIREAVSFLQSRPEVDMVYGNCDFIDISGNIIGSYPARPWDHAELLLRAENFVPQPSVFLRRRVLESVGFLNENLHYAMDFEFWLRLGLEHRVAYVPHRWAAYRWHKGAKSVRGLRAMSSEIVKVYEDFFRRPNLPDGIRALKIGAMSNVFYLAANWLFWADDLIGARRYALAGWRLRPWPVSWTFLKVLVLGWSPLGVRLALALRKPLGRSSRWPDPLILKHR